ncbi:MAG: YceI family protein [Pseudomonadota bacterium]
MLKSLTSQALGLGAGALMLAGAIAISPTSAKAEAADFVLDPTHTSITFFVSHIGYADTAGMFLESEGTFSYDEEAKELKSAAITVKTDSVFTNHDKRDEHLRNADFLNTSEFPEMTFVATKAEKISDTEGKVTGDLTLLGVTNPITLDVTFNKAGNYPFGDGHYALGFDATGSFNRSDFGMSYGVDGGIVGDEIKLVIGAEGIRQD